MVLDVILNIRNVFDEFNFGGAETNHQTAN